MDSRSRFMQWKWWMGNLFQNKGQYEYSKVVEKGNKSLCCTKTDTGKIVDFIIFVAQILCTIINGNLYYNIVYFWYWFYIKTTHTHEENNNFTFFKLQSTYLCVHVSNVCVCCVIFMYNIWCIDFDALVF